MTRDDEILEQCLPGRSAAIMTLKGVVKNVARLPYPVLILGDMGVGKGMVAKAIHEMSGRKCFTILSSTVIPDNLIEAELFGFSKGAFSGAQVSSPGLLINTGDGTILIDQVNEMSELLQAKLLRVLEEGKIRSLGETILRPILARFIFAAHTSLLQQVKEGRFRQDLFFRINTIEIRVPSLSERREDIPVLARAILHTLHPSLTLGEDALATLRNREYRGNLWELKNLLTVAALHNVPVLRAKHIPGEEGAAILENPAAVFAVSSPQEVKPLREVVETYLRRVMELCGGNKTLAAKLLQIDRVTLYKRLGLFKNHQGDATGDAVSDAA